MLILAFDTATPAITVAVHDGSSVLARSGGEGAMAHGEWLAPFIETALRKADVGITDVTDIAVGVGPGPFTGLRVGVVTALTLGSTMGLKTHGVCSLDIIAADVFETGQFLVATDARRKEVYWARYDQDGQRLGEPSVAKPAEVAEQYAGVPVYGRGSVIYSDLLGGGTGPTDPDAGTLAGLVASGRVVTLPLEPLYLRRPDANARGAQKTA